MLGTYRTAIIISLILLTTFLLLVLRPQLSNFTHHAPLHPFITTPRSDILNDTLGFSKVFVINLPNRTDRRDAMTLATTITNITATFVHGISGDEVPPSVLPTDSGNNRSISKGNIGSWRAHMNTLRRVIEEGLESALILEDDVDWDIRLKSQLQIFARAAWAFTSSSPLHNPLLSLDNDNIPISQLPDHHHPNGQGWRSPYGDDGFWDVLWLGHCGTELPGEGSKRVIIPNDLTVPVPKHLKPHPFALQDSEIAELYPAHTRLVHVSHGTTCTQAYAVSQAGARKLLWQFGLQSLTTGWDLMLRDWCDGNYTTTTTTDSKRYKPVCVTVQPPLFSHHFGKGPAAASDITAPGGGFANSNDKKEMSPYIRLSVRLNMRRLLVQGDNTGIGEGALEDQYPD
ncbi:hypothetical protein QBC46DRAFT_439812 [Diplogelasinospora grovesii]|uniref:Glycosyl transferase family 25 domain-containing protein n=1 Tax=Diplogelasinospora grovesii TaxID=303347 RepID=A0AAN6N3Q1_9PEZI|nr:hypothetical protein QBC46DRAFT_439812 [Diplogelasinospora grovesii]